MKLNQRKETAQETLFCTALVSLRALFLTALLLTILPYSTKAQTTQASSTGQAKQAISEAIRLSEEGTPAASRESVKKFEEGISLLHATGDTKGEADALLRLALVQQRLSDHRRALDTSKRALPLYRGLSDRAGEALAIAGIAAAYNRLSDFQRSVDSYNEALPIFRAMQDAKGEAAALAGIGAAYLRLNDYQQALDTSHQALSIYRALNDRAGQASMFQQIGYLHFVQDEYPQAFAAYDEALRLARVISDRGQEAAVLQSLGRAHFRRGNFQTSLDFYAQAMTLERAAHNRSGEATLLGAMAQVYRALGDVEKSRDYLNQTIVVFRETGERLSEATSVNNLGHAHLLLSEYQEALSLFEQSLEICRAINNRAGIASNTNGIGLARAGMGQYRQALEFHRKALELFRSLGHRRAEADSLSHIGRAHHALGEHDMALRNLSEALTLYRSVAASREEIQVLYALARVQHAVGQFIEARAQIDAAINLAERTRQHVANEQLRSSYLASVRDLYALNIDILMQLHRKEPAAGFDGVALETSEKSRARGLLDLLSEARADLRQGVDSAILDRERSLRELISARAEKQTQLLNTKSTPEQRALAARELELLVAELQEVHASIRKNSPRYAALMYPEPLSLKQIQTEVVDADTVLLEYFVGPERSYLWAVTQDRVAAYSIAGSAEIESVARFFYELTRKNGRPDELKQTASRLSKMLLSPAAEHFGKKRLAIVADGALHYVPFASLPEPKNNLENGNTLSDAESLAPTSLSDEAPLIVKHEVINLPSASAVAVLKKEMRGRTAAPKLIAVVADPVFDPNDVRLRRGKTATEHQMANAALQRSVEETSGGAWPLPRLLGTRREASAILKLVPPTTSKQALDFDASRETATAAELADYQIVHFATHALINNRNPVLSGLVLSLVDRDGQTRDGFVRLTDIYNLQLRVDLVVLSACQTGVGKEIRGEGLIGLTRGFMYAGASRLVTSLWQVDDKATSELMIRFYRGMLGSRKLSPSAALREAQVEMWQQKSWRSPYYWAAFSLQGAWN